jgi:enoyl-CoA hydratase
MQEKAVLYERQGKIGMIKFNRPHRLNAINRQLAEGLNEALIWAKNEEGVGVVILTGEGRAFCSGQDLKESAAGQDFLTWVKEAEGLQDNERNMLSLGKPIIAAVRGYALGGGCEFAMGCDIRIAAEDAKFGFPETGVGLTVTGAGTKLLSQLVGLGKAKEIVLTGEFIDAKEAWRLGLVNKVVPGERLLDEALEMARKIGERSPLAIKLSRIAIDQGLSASFEEILELEANHLLVCIGAQNQKEFIDKRLAAMKKD